ncbi:MAG TPA: CaiB/BaiF CoA-transferase family protein [Trebonia sp.]|nr:CaiB/BaiF CoA-transferase family protein [Trebonia sp.]
MINPASPHGAPQPQGERQSDGGPEPGGASEPGTVPKPRGPLAGVRIVELAGIGPVPLAGMLLADLGADVVRVDRPDNVPIISPETDITSRGKRSVIVDLKHKRGAGVVLDLASRADVLLEGLRPGVTERLGIGPDDCWARNPPLVYGRMTGWGQDGPLAQSAGHDIGYIAVTGALHAIGRAGGPPQIPVNYLGDFGGGSMFLVLGVMAALWESRASGRGQVVDAAIVDGTASLQAMTYSMLAGNLWRDERGVNMLDSGAPYYDVYETADGRHMAVGAIEPKFYAEFVRLLFDGAPPAGVPDRGAGGGGQRARSEIAKRFLTRTQAQWAVVFEGTDACVAPVVSLTEAPAHPHLAARATYVEVDGIIQPGVAPRFSRTPGVAGTIALPGAHSREVLADWGVTDAAALLAAGVVRERPLLPPGASQPAPLRRGTGCAYRTRGY